MVADNPPQAGRPAPGKEKGAAPAGWGSWGASVAASTLAERKRVARRSRAGSRASQRCALVFPVNVKACLVPATASWVVLLQPQRIGAIERGAVDVTRGSRLLPRGQSRRAWSRIIRRRRGDPPPARKKARPRPAGGPGVRASQRAR